MFTIFEIAKCVQVFDSIIGSGESTSLCGSTALGDAANGQILLACNLTVFSMV